MISYPIILAITYRGGLYVLINHNEIGLTTINNDPSVNISKNDDGSYSLKSNVTYTNRVWLISGNEITVL